MEKLIIMVLNTRLTQLIFDNISESFQKNNLKIKVTEMIK